MKKITVNTIIALALGSMCLSSCIGSFSLTNNVLNWNKRATDNKFINELIFIVISPAYAVCSAADLLVLNTIEFWTGDKVIANVGKTQKVTGKDGRLYAIKTLKNGYEITDPAGEKSYFVFNKKNKSWSYSKDGDIRSRLASTIETFFVIRERIFAVDWKISSMLLRLSLNQPLISALSL